jgi:hypothetical protein
MPIFALKPLFPGMVPAPSRVSSRAGFGAPTGSVREDARLDMPSSASGDGHRWRVCATTSREARGDGGPESTLAVRRS